ncbi:AEC family transporter [Facklamia lactis]|uniref:AEC family transporter n=1 Tax=Facklamia lactis TaxID=2749967 RepID=UPI0018CD5137|nr:AEC family transporter [Facklamia lactis]MBG9980221.1 AEC family transporter [Facklamia lactis]
MELAVIIFQQLLILIGISFIGFVLVKRSVLSQQTISEINQIIIKYLTPLLIVESFFQPFDQGQTQQMLIAMLVYGGIMLIRVVVGNLIYGRFQEGVSKFATVFGNVGFIGIPLTRAVFGPSMVIITTGILIINNFISWTIGLDMISVKETNRQPKFLQNSIIFAFAIGLFIRLLNLSLPPIMIKGVAQLTSIYSPLAMIVLGSYFVDLLAWEEYRDRRLWLTVVLRLLIWPLLTLGILIWIPHLSFETFYILMMILSGPCAMMTSLLSQIVGGDYLYGAKLVLLTTVGSTVTTPIMLYLSSWLYQSYYPYLN